MRRVAALRGLSSDHHGGLVLVRRARQAAGGTAAEQAQTWQDVRQRFVGELEPHFLIEERGLLQALHLAGEVSQVERTLSEHRAMRALIAEDLPGNLARFADLLEAHIRFEEKTLFETAQRVLTPAALAALEEAEHGLRVSELPEQSCGRGLGH
jgi:Hemerythrin HHE cation binding domain